MSLLSCIIAPDHICLKSGDLELGVQEGLVVAASTHLDVCGVSRFAGVGWFSCSHLC